MKKPTTTEIIARFKAKHGDRYLYDTTHYISSSQKVTVVCRIHGVFEILPGHHANGTGCRSCYFDTRRIQLRDFIRRSSLHFGGIYNYDRITSLVSRIVSIDCTRHATTFSQDWRSHINGHTGCLACQKARLSGAASTRGSLKSSEELTADFILRARETHGERYDYSMTSYVKATEKVAISCGHHGQFLQTPLNHIAGSQCPGCTKEARYPASLKAMCNGNAVLYYRALKRRQAGLTIDKILSPSILRHSRETAPYTVGGVSYPNLQEAARVLGSPVSTTTVIRRLSQGICPEEAFTSPPTNAGHGGVIYLITNRVTGKKYVGLTTQHIGDRWAHHLQQAARMAIRSPMSLHASIREYGADNFALEILDRGTANVDLERKERQWISHHECIAPLGYNLSPGGTSGGSKPRPTEIDGKAFRSARDAAQYVAHSRNITVDAAKWRIRKGKIDL